MTYRERRERRAERRRDWADGRAAKADATSDQARTLADRIPFGQPILVGHHSEKRHRRDIERIDSNMRKTVEHHDMADRHTRAADTIEAQLETSIYDDDPDAIEQLRERIEQLEAKRARIKAYNASCRKGAPDLDQLTTEEALDLSETARVCSYQIGDKGQAPAYWLTNLGGNINRNKKRLKRLEQAEAQDEARAMIAQAKQDTEEMERELEHKPMPARVAQLYAELERTTNQNERSRILDALESWQA